jgi:hypothetical protein
MSAMLLLSFPSTPSIRLLVLLRLGLAIFFCVVHGFLFPEADSPTFVWELLSVIRCKWFVVILKLIKLYRNKTAYFSMIYTSLQKPELLSVRIAFTSQIRASAMSVKIVRNYTEYVTEVDSNNITFIQSLVQTGQLSRKVKWGMGHNATAW